MMRRHLFVLACVAFAFWTAAASPSVGTEVAPCPQPCVCNASGVICSNVNGSEIEDLLDRLNAGAGGLVINSLAIRSCSSPIGRLERVPPQLRVRALEISKCGVSYISNDALTAFAGDLIQLRLMANDLSAVPAIGVLAQLQVLNLNGNSVSFSSSIN